MSDSIYLLLLLCAGVTYAWRVLGVFIGRKLDPESSVFDWLNCVAYALLAGLMARVIVFPAGVLSDTSLFFRLLAIFAGFVVFFALGRNFLVATFVSSLAFFLLLGTTDAIP